LNLKGGQMATYYDVTLGVNIPHGVDILDRPCKVVFSYPGGSHSQEYPGTLFAWREPNLVCMVSNYMNIEAAWTGANGGVLTIDSGNSGVLTYPITGFVNIGTDNAIETSQLLTRRSTMAGYKVTINMKPETVTKLVDGLYNLYGFKAVQSTQGGGAPLVWFKMDEFSANNHVDWTVQYQAYTSRSVIIPNGQITASYNTDIDLGQQLNVVAGGTGSVASGGPSTAISIYNTTETPFACGISEVVAGTAKALCAFPLYGTQLDVMAPIAKVLLMFSTNPVNTGTVIEQAYSPGIFIDLTAKNERTVDYDINTGWSWGGAVWARQIPPNANLVPLLIESPGLNLLVA
jgi:hypothetical protein